MIAISDFLNKENYIAYKIKSIFLQINGATAFQKSHSNSKEPDEIFEMPIF